MNNCSIPPLSKYCSKIHPHCLTLHSLLEKMHSPVIKRVVELIIAAEINQSFKNFDQACQEDLRKPPVNSTRSTITLDTEEIPKTWPLPNKMIQTPQDRLLELVHNNDSYAIIILERELSTKIFKQIAALPKIKKAVINKLIYLVTTASPLSQIIFLTSIFEIDFFQEIKNSDNVNPTIETLQEEIETKNITCFEQLLLIYSYQKKFNSLRKDLPKLNSLEKATTGSKLGKIIESTINDAHDRDTVIADLILKNYIKEPIEDSLLNAIQFIAPNYSVTADEAFIIIKQIINYERFKELSPAEQGEYVIKKLKPFISLEHNAQFAFIYQYLHNNEN